jgi:hypothetical protein
MGREANETMSNSLPQLKYFKDILLFELEDG